MSLRKKFKELKKLLKLSEEQEDIFTNFYRDLPADAFKTFETQEDFNEYMQDKLSEIDKKHNETLKALQDKMNQTKINNVISSFTSDEKQAKILKTMTDLNEVDLENDEAIKAAFEKTIKEFPEQLGVKKSIADKNALIKKKVITPNNKLPTDDESQKEAELDEFINELGYDE